MIYYLLSTEKEAGIFRLLSQGKIQKGRIEVIGKSGFGDREYTDMDILVNVGFASGYKVAVGSLVEPVYAIDAWTQEAIRTDTIFPVEHRICYSSEEFADTPMVDFASIYDKELFGIVSRPHKRVHALKIISDNLDAKKREKFNGEEAWKRAIELIGRYVKE